jgi:hypothetical protein
MATVAGRLEPGADQICLILFVLEQSDTHVGQFAPNCCREMSVCVLILAIGRRCSAITHI